MSKIYRIAVALFASLAAMLSTAVRADTLNMPVNPPIAFVEQVDMKYKIEASVLGNIGKFTANGVVTQLTGVNNITTPFNGTFSLTAYFNPTTGTIIKDHVNDLFDPTLDVKDSSAVAMYSSRHINRFAYDLGVMYPTFDFEFFNEGGSQTVLNPMEYIGVTLRNTTTFSGTKSFISLAAPGTTVFDNNTLLGIERGTANVFMTPTPSAIGGGAMLLGCILLRGTMRRRQAFESTN